MVSSSGVPGDETMGRIADLASDWTIDDDALPDPELPTVPDPARPSAANAPRHGATAAPARKAIEETAEVVEDFADFAEVSALARPATPAAPRPPPLPPGARPRAQVPAPGKRPPRAGPPLDLRGLPEADKTKENRGAVGVKHAHSGALTTNAASGMIGDDHTPIFDRVAIAAGPRGGRAPSTVAPVLGTPRPVSVGDSRTETAPAPSSPYAKPSSSLISIKATRIDRSAAAELDDTRIPPPASRVEPRAIIPALPGAFMIGGATFNDSSSSLTAPLDLRRLRDPGAPRAPRDERDERDDATAALVPALPIDAGATRTVAALRRKRGLAGDLRYVATVVFGLRRARRELAVLDAQQATRAQARRRQLVALGQIAITDGVAHAALEPARAELARIDAERAQHAERVTAGEAELTRVRADREAHAKQHAIDLATLDAALVALARQLEPLEQAAAAHRRRAAEQRDAIEQLGAQIARTEANLAGPKRAQLDVAATQARLAALTADRAASQRDEPAIARTLDALYPQIAAIQVARAEAQRSRAERIAAEQDDQDRAQEVRAAIAARRKVLDRAAADAAALRDKRLRELGDRLSIDRTAALADALAPIDDLDQERGVADRRALELHEIVASVDRWKLARGVVLLVVVLAALAAATATAAALYLTR
jgi:hypothetical protein